MLVDKMSSVIKFGLTATKVFFYGFIIDFMYVLWFASVAEDKTLLAGGAAILLALPGILGILSILEDKRLAVPYLLGLSCGTMASMAIF